MRLIAALARSPTRERNLHPERLVRTQVIVLVTKSVQPILIRRIGMAAANRALQRSMHPLHFALRLRMAERAVEQPHALPDDPHGELGKPPDRKSTRLN